ncbi:unnamed protein product, partial [Symbiodinium sp. CCMP2456]
MMAPLVPSHGIPLPRASSVPVVVSRTRSPAQHLRTIYIRSKTPVRFVGAITSRDGLPPRLPSVAPSPRVVPLCQASLPVDREALRNERRESRARRSGGRRSGLESLERQVTQAVKIAAAS